MNSIIQCITHTLFLSYDNEDLIKQHAETGGFPANKISEVTNVISPKTAE